MTRNTFNLIRNKVRRSRKPNPRNQVRHVRQANPRNQGLYKKYTRNKKIGKRSISRNTGGDDEPVKGCGCGR